MPAKRRIIIDTDPGVDDVLAMLYALSMTSDELEVLLISLTFGNVDVQSCLRNVVAVFHILEKELEWRKSQPDHSRLPKWPGYEGITKYKPLVAIGAEEPLQDVIENADFFHGIDGLAGTHTSHPHFFSPEESWKRLFEQPPPDSEITKAAKSQPDINTEDLKSTVTEPDHSFTPSLQPAHKEILRLLKENDPETITLISIGPLTNFALAAAEDPETFLRCQSVISMGGAIDEVGNVTPVAEFNVYADPYAAARVYALTSMNPASTLPITAEDSNNTDKVHQPYPSNLSKQLKLVLLSLDITEQHILTRKQFNQYSTELSSKESPLAKWMKAFMTPMLDKMERLHLGHEGEGAALALHDPLCLYYVLTSNDKKWKASEKSPEDIRIETQGQWTRGMTLRDKRLRKRRLSDGEVPHDRGNWLGSKSGNKIIRLLKSPSSEPKEKFGEVLIKSIFGY